MTHTQNNDTTTDEMSHQALPEGGDCSETNGVCRWLTVPYAEPLSKRFAKSKPLHEYAVPKHSSANDGYGPVCIQWFPGLALDQSEDCLTLNIWAPYNNNDTKTYSDTDEHKPVMVWIHGGAFLEGGGATNLAAYGLPGNPLVKLYDGANLAARHDVIVVAIQYRLGPFGFLAPGGANGLGDQVSALHWIQEHIARFGGDPQKVTLFGESSGSVSTCTLLHTPATKGLFHRVILQSGTCYPSLDYILSKEDALVIREKYLDSLYNSNSDHLDLETAPAEDILNRTFDAFNGDWMRIFLAGLGAPSVDGDILPNLPIHLTPHQGVDVLVGTTSFDQTVSTIAVGRNAFLSDFGITSAVEYSYSTDDDANLFLDACLRCQSQRVLQRVVAEGGGAGYWYTFDCPHDAAPHASDIPVVLGNVDDSVQFLIGPRPSEELIERVQEAWVSFATTGDPGWEEATKSGMGALIGCKETTIQPLMDAFGTCDLWTSAADDMGSLDVGTICFRDSYVEQQQQSTPSTTRSPLVVSLVIAACLACASFCVCKKRRAGYSTLR
jgi:para-nitrobenzyl esterase